MCCSRVPLIDCRHETPESDIFLLFSLATVQQPGHPGDQPHQRHHPAQPGLLHEVEGHQHPPHLHLDHDQQRQQSNYSNVNKLSRHWQHINHKNTKDKVNDSLYEQVQVQSAAAE